MIRDDHLISELADTYCVPRNVAASYVEHATQVKETHGIRGDGLDDTLHRACAAHALADARTEARMQSLLEEHVGAYARVPLVKTGTDAQPEIHAGDYVWNPDGTGHVWQETPVQHRSYGEPITVEYDLSWFSSYDPQRHLALKQDEIDTMNDATQLTYIMATYESLEDGVFGLAKDYSTLTNHTHPQDEEKEILENTLLPVIDTALQHSIHHVNGVPYNAERTIDGLGEHLAEQASPVVEQQHGPRPTEQRAGAQREKEMVLNKQVLPDHSRVFQAYFLHSENVIPVKRSARNGSKRRHECNERIAQNELRLYEDLEGPLLWHEQQIRAAESTEPRRHDKAYHEEIVDSLRSIDEDNLVSNLVPFRP